MKDSLDKQDKTKAVDIFQVMADAIQKEFAQIFLWSLNIFEFFNIYFMRYNYLKNFEQIALQSKNNQISGLSQNSDVTTQYSAATLAAASKFKRVLGIVSTIHISTEREMTLTLICPGKGGLRCEAGTVHHQQLSLGHGAEGEYLVSIGSTFTV